MITVTVTGNQFEQVSKTKSLQSINDNCNASQLEQLSRMATNKKLNKLLTKATIDKLEKNITVLKSFL